MKEKLTICPYCKSSNIEFDYHHAEAYCKECGLIVIDNSSTRYMNITEKITVDIPSEYERLCVAAFLVHNYSCYKYLDGILL